MKTDERTIVNLIARVPLFKNFPQENLKQIAGDMKIIHVDKKDNVVIQADNGTDLFIVLRGSVNVSILNNNGNQLVLATLKDGDFFGEMSLIDGKSRSATITAEEDTSMCVLKRERFFHAMRQDPVIAYEMLNVLVQRLRHANELIESLAFHEVNERLARYLIQCAKNDAVKDKNGFYRVKKITHKNLASRVGSSREAVSKALQALTFKKLIIEKGDDFLISPDAYAKEYDSLYQ